MTKTTITKARKRHLCDDTYVAVCGHYIEPGDIYARHVVSPGDPEIGNEHWWTIRECAGCHAKRTGVTLTEALWQTLHRDYDKEDAA